MPDYGVTSEGFVIKPFTTILQDKFDRAQSMFGADVDLQSSSALRKLLEITSAEDQELWKGMEQFYYSNFLSTASGGALDLLGDDMGVQRRFLYSQGNATLTLSNQAPGKTYNLPTGTLLETDAPVQRFRTLALAAVSDQSKKTVVAVEALERGPDGDVAAAAINKINVEYAEHHLDLGAATIAVSNDAPTSGGDFQEDDASYRRMLLGYPRTVWTLDAVRRAVLAVDGVRDCRVFDPLGGLDVSQSIFNVFAFSERRFGTQRLLGSPYYFDILVAIYPGFLWENQMGIAGLQETITEAISDVRPISIFPNISRANSVIVGLRADIRIKPGHDGNGIVASIKERLAQRVAAQTLGSSVLYSEVQCDCMAVSGVVDVQGLHLRRCPPLFSSVTFGNRLLFQSEVIEEAVGENIDLLPNEIPEFQVDSALIALEVSDR